LPKVAPVGSDEMLKKMGRGYTIDEYRRLVGWLRGRMPDIALSTDVIVGFPGETEEDFDHTIDVLKKVRFDFAYTPFPQPCCGYSRWRRALSGHDSRSWV
jgi:tRNA-2-methylthio-N6-dimethylallyladenosine synthase